MRIISGKFKGKLISFVKSRTTRPLKDSVKEIKQLNNRLVKIIT